MRRAGRAMPSVWAKIFPDGIVLSQKLHSVRDLDRAYAGATCNLLFRCKFPCGNFCGQTFSVAVTYSKAADISLSTHTRKEQRGVICLSHIDPLTRSRRGLRRSTSTTEIQCESPPVSKGTFRPRS